MTKSRTLVLAGAVLAAALFASAGVALFAWAGPAQAGGIERVSVATGGSQGGEDSGLPSLSADGRYVAFYSFADDLVMGDTNGVADVFVYDRQTNAIKRVSVATGGAQGNSQSRGPVISADGTCVAFLSHAGNLVSGDTNGAWDVFVHDLATGVTTRVSLGAGGAQGNGDSTRVALSANGKIVCFGSRSTNLVASDTNGVADVFVFDRQTGVTTRVSVGAGGVQADDWSDFASISADGRYVAFDSSATNLVSGDGNGRWDVFVHDRSTGETALASLDGVGTKGNGDSLYPSISADGSLVAFASSADNLVSGDTNGRADIFVRDQGTGQTTRASVATDGVQGDGDGDSASLSADGRYVAFASDATGLVPGDTNGAWDVFVYDRQTGVTQRLDLAEAGTQAGDDSDAPAISADGTQVAFESWADDLVPADTNVRADVFVAGVVDVATVTGVSPSAGGNGGGTRVVITGTNFTGVNAVKFGGTSAAFQVDSDTQITAIAPAHAAGNAQVQVTARWIPTANTAADDFTYIAPTLFQQTDTRLTYAGSWYNATASSASGGSYRYANSSGSSVTLSFTGIGLALLAKTGPTYGQAKVTLDGGTPAYVDLYSSSILYKRNVYGTGELENKAHALTIEWAGAKNPASSGYLVTVDALYVAGSLNQPAGASGGVVCFQQTDTRLAYAGSWYNATASAASGGSYRYANSPGASLKVDFHGTALALMAKKAPSYGQAKVTLDGGTPVYVDLYGPSTSYLQNVYGTGTLTEGNHSLTIEWAGAKNAASSGYLVTVDAFYVAGTLNQAASGGVTCFQQTDTRLSYAGSWYNAALSAASGGSYAYANSSGASVTVRFSGTGLALIAKKSPAYGQAKLTLDGGDPAYVDLYSPSTGYQQNVYGTGALADTDHVLTIEWAGAKNPASSGYLITVDALYVAGTLR